MKITLSNHSGRLYRILRFDRAVQMFEKGEMFFAHPSTWDDPYEVHVRHSKSHQTFGQCWCTRGVSDAMWRIYSQNNLGVRISTSTRALREALKPAISKRGFNYREGEVQYYSQNFLKERVTNLRAAFRADPSANDPTDVLFMKRNAFDYEHEYRVLLTDPFLKPSERKAGVLVKVNPHKFVDSILLDPRAPAELVEAFAFYFREKLKFKHRVQSSVLYKVPATVDLT